MNDKTQQTNAQIEQKELRDLDVPEKDAEGVKGGFYDLLISSVKAGPPKSPSDKAAALNTFGGDDSL